MKRNALTTVKHDVHVLTKNDRKKRALAGCRRLKGCLFANISLTFNFNNIRVRSFVLTGAPFL